MKSIRFMHGSSLLVELPCEGYIPGQIRYTKDLLSYSRKIPVHEIVIIAPVDFLSTVRDDSDLEALSTWFDRCKTDNKAMNARDGINYQQTFITLPNGGYSLN